MCGKLDVVMEAVAVQHGDYPDHRWLMILALCAKVASNDCLFKGQVVQHYNSD
jgi:hypothetical protein